MTQIVGEQFKGFRGVQPLCLGPMYLGRTSWQWDKMEKAITLTNKKGLETKCNLQKHDLFVPTGWTPNPPSFRASQNNASTGNQMLNTQASGEHFIPKL